MVDKLFSTYMFGGIADGRPIRPRQVDLPGAGQVGAPCYTETPIKNLVMVHHAITLIRGRETRDYGVAEAVDDAGRRSPTKYRGSGTFLLAVGIRIVLVSSPRRLKGFISRLVFSAGGLRPR